ncbi:hypothetical protein RV11_GL002266 [Enterococcus phoeniculicola]|nr:hypothetical protein RV11_GL002266 [Enterococcus phoeniculicola]
MSTTDAKFPNPIKAKKQTSSLDLNNFMIHRYQLDADKRFS